MKKVKNKYQQSPNFEMAQIMVGQWTDERLKGAVGMDLVRSFGVTITEGDAIIKQELRKRKWL